MADMTATGWDAAGAVNIIKQQRRHGLGGGKRATVQLVFNPTNFGDGADTYPSNGIPCPSPSNFGMSVLSYLIPMSQLMPPGNGPTTFTSRCFPWSCVPPTWGTSGAAAQTISPVMRLICGPALVPGPSGATPVMNHRSLCNELTTDTAASDICPTAVSLVAYAIAVGR